MTFKHNFAVGDNCNFGGNGDAYPCTVVRVTPTKVITQDASYDCVKSASNYGADDAVFTYNDNPNGRIRTFTVRKNGRVIEQGSNGWGFLNHHWLFKQNPSF